MMFSQFKVGDFLKVVFTTGEGQTTGLTPVVVDGLGGNLVIQPEYQRNYLYDKGGKDKEVIDSILQGYPLGLVFFYEGLDDKGNPIKEVLDGQQRITSIGRFITGKFAIDFDGNQQVFSSLPKGQQQKILDFEIPAYICKGAESEIMKWFKIINVAGIPLNDQELLNATYSGPFVTKAKEVFSNPDDARVSMWQHYIKGDVNRQDILHTALDWVAKKNNTTIDAYLSSHRENTEITELEKNFTTIIEWIDSRFPDATYKEMKGRDWGRFYREYGQDSYNAEEDAKTLEELMADEAVTDKKGIFEYILGGCQETRLLNVRIFDEKTKRTVYQTQNNEAKEQGVSNCPSCAAGNNTNKKVKLYPFSQMQADHVTAWSNGGDSSLDNYELPTH